MTPDLSTLSYPPGPSDIFSLDTPVTLLFWGWKSAGQVPGLSWVSMIIAFSHELFIHLFVYLNPTLLPRVWQLEKTIQCPLSTPVPEGQWDPGA